MPISEARRKANDKYIKAQDEIKIRVPKGRKDEIQAHAAAKGESLNGYVTKAVDERIERDRAVAGDSGSQKAPDGGK